MRSRAPRRNPAVPVSTSRGRRHVIFALAGVAYAVDAAVVRRSLPVPEPLTPDVAFLGQPYPLVDLRTFFRLPPSADPGRLVLLVQTAGGRAGLIVDDLVDTGSTARVVREMLPGAHFATVYAKPKGRDLVDTFITEVSQDTWIFFPWDLDVAYVAPISGGTD